MRTPASALFTKNIVKCLSPEGAGPCPKCAGACTSECKCSMHHKTCVNGHTWADIQKESVEEILARHVYFKRLDEDEWYDEVRMSTVPRYKQSGLSGDEWRHHVEIEFLRKGVVLKSKGFHSLKDALAAAPGILFYYAPADDDAELVKAKQADFDSLCFQPSCANKATVEYRLKKEYCNVAPHDGGHDTHGDTRRRFCDKHKTRGDCGFEDSDMNYETVPLLVK